MQKPNKKYMKKIAFVLSIILFIVSCQKDNNSPEKIDPPFLTNAGNSFPNSDGFKVKLNANEISENEKGVWTIISGLVEDKVFFNDKNNPKTIFNGLPGEEYKLVWTVTNNLGKTATDTITVSFLPLKTEITNRSLNFYKTRLFLEAKNYDKGEWTIQGGLYNRIVPYAGSEALKSFGIKFYGFENTNYKLTWTTWYGSKSASTSIDFNSGTYQQDEALEDLNVLNRTNRYKKDANGNVIELNMNGDGYGNLVFESYELFPTSQALIHLKKLGLDGDGLSKFPEVITTKYLNLEVLEIGNNGISSLPENIGNLKKLDTLYLNHSQYGAKLNTLPESFGQLTNLRYLDLNDMGITSLPDSFCNLTQLNYLNLTNDVIDKIPANFGNLSNLESINRIETYGDIPDSFSNLSNLKICNIYLYGNASNTLPTDFGKLTNLEELYLDGTFTKLPDSFSDLSKLKRLEIGNVYELPTNFGNLKNLEIIFMSGGMTSLPPSFVNLSKLYYLEIHAKLEYLPVDFGKLIKLDGLSLFSNNLKAIPDSFGDLENLHSFIAYQNQIQIIPDSFGNLKNLNKVDLSYNSISNFPNTLANLAGILNEVVIRGNNYSTDELNHLKSMLPMSIIITQ